MGRRLTGGGGGLPGGEAGRRGRRRQGRRRTTGGLVPAVGAELPKVDLPSFSGVGFLY
jgi:hypothetical protein